MAKNASQINTGSFPTMGTVAAPVNASGAPSRNTSPVAKGHASGGMLEGATARHRGPRLNETNGPSFRIQASTSTAPLTNPEAGSTYRNVRLVKSAVGNRDFWDKRNSGV